MSKEAMKLALEALEYIEHNYMSLPAPAEKAITALREALAEQPAQQDSTCNNALRIQGKAYPRTCKKCGLGPCVELAQQTLDKKTENARELGLDYEPVQDGGIVTAGGFDPRTRRTWVGLTDEEIDRLWSQSLADTESETWLPLREFARAIEAAHGIKENT